MPTDKHLCDTCAKHIATCDAKHPVFGIDIDPSARGAAADRVVTCEAWQAQVAPTALTDDEIMAMFYTVSPSWDQLAAMAYVDDDTRETRPTYELRRLVELAVAEGMRRAGNDQVDAQKGARSAE